MCFMKPPLLSICQTLPAGWRRRPLATRLRLASVSECAPVTVQIHRGEVDLPQPSVFDGSYFCTTSIMLSSAFRSISLL